MFTHTFGNKVLIFLLLLILFLNFKNNLTAEEKATVWSLKNNKDIIIKQTKMAHCSSYSQEGLNPHHYRPIEHSTSNLTAATINGILLRL